MVGAIDSPQHMISPGFKEAGDVIVQIGLSSDLGGSMLAYRKDGKKLPGPIAPEHRDDFLQRMVALQKLMLDCIGKKLFKSAQDISEGGLAVALAECCLFSENGCGAAILLDEDEDLPAFLFGEPGGSILVTIDTNRVEELREVLDHYEILDFMELGEVTADGVLTYEGEVSLTVAEIKAAHDTNPYAEM